MFSLFKRKKLPQKWREFACYLGAFHERSEVAMAVIRRANELGLQGKKISVLVRERKIMGDDQIWFEGEN